MKKRTLDDERTKGPRTKPIFEVKNRALVVNFLRAFHEQHGHL